MTNRKLAKSNAKRPYNKKDPQPPRQTKTQRQAAGDEMDAAGFKMIDWNKWTYTWPFGEFPSFRLVPGMVDFRPGWIAICDDGRHIPIGTAPAMEIKQRLDDEIAAIIGMDVIDIDGFMLAGLPQTNPPTSTRVGAEYGVIV
jgi:hypothetical protein